MSNSLTAKRLNNSVWHGEAWQIKDRKNTLSVTVARRGARIVSLEYNGLELLAADKEAFAKLGEIETLPRTSDMWGVFSALGGEVPLVAPQASWGEGQVPFFAHAIAEAGLFEVKQESPGKVSINSKSPLCPESSLGIERTISIGQESKNQAFVEIRASLFNGSESPIKAAPWSILKVQSSANVKTSTTIKPTQDVEAYEDHNDGMIPKGAVWQLYPEAIHSLKFPASECFKVGLLFSGQNGDIKTVFARAGSSPDISMAEKFYLSSLTGYPHNPDCPVEFYACWDGAHENERLLPLQLLESEQQSETLIRRLVISEATS